MVVGLIFVFGFNQSTAPFGAPPVKVICIHRGSAFLAMPTTNNIMLIISIFVIIFVPSIILELGGGIVAQNCARRATTPVFPSVFARRIEDVETMREYKR